MRQDLKKIGLSPGTLTIPEGSRPEKARLAFVQYSPEETNAYDNLSLDALLKLINPNLNNWIQVQGILDLQLIEDIGKAFQIHPLFLEDIVTGEQRPKFESYANNIYIVCRLLRFHHDKVFVEDEQIALVLSKNILISFTESDNGLFTPIMHRLSKQRSKIRENKTDYLCYSLLDLITDYNFATIDQIDVHIDKLEGELTRHPQENAIIRIQNTKRLIVSLRNGIWPMREVINQFQRSSSPLIDANTKFYLHDVADHLEQIMSAIENFREITGTLLELNLSFLSQKMNDVIRTLTIVATIFVPLTFITSFYGMNFKHMPELDFLYGYPVVIGIMIATALGMLYLFHKKKWL